MGLGEEYHRGEVPFSSRHFRGYMMSSDFITGDVNLDCFVEVEFARFLPCEVFSFSLSILYSLEISH